MTGLVHPRTVLIRTGVCMAALAAIICICALVGTQDISLVKVLEGPGTAPGQNVDYEIFVRVRLPRVLLAALAGAALAASGVVLQAILKNPLADPYILGISSGAGLGVVAAVLSGVTWSFGAGSPVALFAFVGAISSVWLVWFVGYLAGRAQITTLLLAGVVVNAFLSAVIMFLTSIISSEQLHATVYWLMGNITEKDFAVLAVSAALIIPGIAGLCGLSHRLNVLCLGDEQAQSMGVNPATVRFAGFALAALVTAAAVGLSGLIGFVGLIVPHAVRLVVGPDHRQLLPISAIVGASFLVIADTIARIIIAPAQLPAGVITAIAGGPFFLVLLAKYSRKMSGLR